MGTTTRTRAAKRLATAGLTGTIALALVGCGGSGGSSSATAAASGATSAGASATAASASPSPSVPDLAELSGRVTAAVKAKGTARIVGSSAGGTRSTGAIRYRGSSADFSVTTEAGGKKITMVILGGVAYLNLGQKVQGKSWLRIRPGGSDPLSKGFAPLLNQLSTGLDFKSQLGAAAGSKVTDARRAEVGGTAVTQYTVVTSEKALLAQLDKAATSPEQKKLLRSQFKGAHSEAVISIGDDDLPVRVESRVVGGSVPVETTIEYKDWGAPVTIAAPPAAQVIDAAAA